ncbi:MULTISPECIES: type VI secretion system baseplate subunit TssE [Thalassolituus]|jgi:type VI secretion system protein ImpF|uniref:Type VI secretion system lysozyme-related protein n=1 Tax=Thalassolituus oleivorans MIL-1 TaxID=1298593 RepID=M5DN06_9GAMM|nr:type VI secretion system baseplate subunit TssE [Thalassolituus oleivorans]PCI47447.1 MAG: type VI secretion system baseplate subunit TssE [Oceanospirillales bacterium]AHK14844.1 type VI secretion protein [Thalassolituus oleivorans R6-15]MBQ0728721.1 type VI secretion system baseplate subunit TssE [Thalassolituus oleivorans]MBQ0780502.1 type VI secretion system baseplate subunit TssE [Thalassolituus oleivorans]MDF1641231.1 type VI secretion system baseplate subunit TssE [Thalassolituus olei
MVNKREKRLLAPVLDRLLEQNQSSDFRQSHRIQRCLRESIRRDLENLFNTRYCCVSPPEAYKNLDDSVLNYGLPDLSTINMSSFDSRNDFCRKIEKTVLKYEPRIKTVKVKTDAVLDNEDPTIRFRVEATLHMNPVQELMIFESTLNPINQTVNVSELF